MYIIFHIKIINMHCLLFCFHRLNITFGAFNKKAYRKKRPSVDLLVCCMCVLSFMLLFTFIEIITHDTEKEKVAYTYIFYQYTFIYLLIEICIIYYFLFSE